jgi:putative iron-dependent peroxidase
LVIGRTKLEDIEIPDTAKPSNSHVALNTVIDVDGKELKIVRANMPFGDLGTGESGTYYIAYSADPDVPETMLRNMFLGVPPGNSDRILDFSTAHTGGLFFAPATGFLNDPPPLPDRQVGTSQPPPPRADATFDHSLAIGSLKGRC